MLYPAYEGEIHVNPGAYKKSGFNTGRNAWVRSGKEPVMWLVSAFHTGRNA